MKLLVTGGAGFIGSALVRHLIANTEHEVINFDKLTYAGNLNSLPDVLSHPRYCHVQEDLCDADAVNQAFEKYQPDAVMHLAAESHVDRSIEGPADFINTNIVGTFNLLEAAKIYWQSLSESAQNQFRFLHISTDEVFGDLDGTDALFTEETPYHPSSPYAASKASSDHLVRAWHRTYDLPILISNCSNNYGPYQFPEKLIPHVTLNALQHKALPIYGDGQQIRDWLFVEDHVDALMCILLNGEIGESYNVGGHNEKTNLEVVTTICGILDQLCAEQKPEGRAFDSLIKFVEDRPGHDRRYAIDASAIYEKLGWRPKQTFETGLQKTIEWYLENESWWQSVLSGDYQLTRIGRKQ